MGSTKAAGKIATMDVAWLEVGCTQDRWHTPQSGSSAGIEAFLNVDPESDSAMAFACC